jgi:hypothetical protein
MGAGLFRAILLPSIRDRCGLFCPRLHEPACPYDMPRRPSEDRHNCTTYAIRQLSAICEDYDETFILWRLMFWQHERDQCLVMGS